MQKSNNQASLQEHQQALLVLLREFDRVCRCLNIPYVLFAGTMLGAVRHGGFIPWDDDLDVMMLREDYERFFREAGEILDNEKFYLQEEFTEHWPMFFSKLRLNGTTCLEKYHPRDPNVHQGVYMDIFPCDATFSTSLGKKLQLLASKVVIAKALDERGYDTDSRIKKAFMAMCRLLPMKPFLSLTKGGKRNSQMVHSFLGGASSYQKSIYPRAWLESCVQIQFEDGFYPIPAEYDALLKVLYGDYMQLPPPEQRKWKEHSILTDLNHSYEVYTGYRDDMKFEIHTRSIR